LFLAIAKVLRKLYAESRRTILHLWSRGLCRTAAKRSWSRWDKRALHVPARGCRYTTVLRQRDACAARRRVCTRGDFDPVDGGARDDAEHAAIGGYGLKRAPAAEYERNPLTHASLHPHPRLGAATVPE